MSCSACGSEVPGAARFCPSCGSAVDIGATLTREPLATPRAGSPGASPRKAGAQKSYVCDLGTCRIELEHKCVFEPG